MNLTQNSTKQHMLVEKKTMVNKNAFSMSNPYNEKSIVRASQIIWQFHQFSCHSYIWLQKLIKKYICLNHQMSWNLKMSPLYCDLTDGGHICQTAPHLLQCSLHLQIVASILLSQYLEIWYPSKCQTSSSIYCLSYLWLCLYRRKP